jgi:4-aminobutyrate aminotransferase-like enzyme/Ser/Thr protein kinase RdoA (MazF antagonist)
MKSQRPKAPSLTVEDARRLSTEFFGVEGTIRPLPSYIDQNFLVECGERDAWVLKVANGSEEEPILDLENRAMERLAQAEPGIAPRIRTSMSGREIEAIELRGSRHLIRLVSYLPGPLLADATGVARRTWESLGEALGRVDRALEGFSHPAMKRWLRWDLAHAEWVIGRDELFKAARRRHLVQRFGLQFLGDVKRVLPNLPQTVVYNDANNRNITVQDGATGTRVQGFFDFGDIVYTARVFEVAVACAYAILDQHDPLQVMGALVRGYHSVLPLTDGEFRAVFPSMCMRLVLSVTISAQDAKQEPENDYIRVSEDSAWQTLDRLSEVEPTEVETALRHSCGEHRSEPGGLPQDRILALRRRYLSPSLSLSYRKPIEIVRGRMQYLFDSDGRCYLDCVNNVCHVGHCHPKVVEAAQRQIELLNTNTRYLHENIVRYAERLLALIPDPLNVCFVVNSGSEANELAVRLARTYTGRYDIIAIKAGYHGNTSTLIDLSSYKHDGPGGSGPPEWLHRVPCPDTYRGLYRENDPDAASKYADHVREAIENAQAQGREIAGFISEPVMGCGGQIFPPDGYLRDAYRHARASGAVCIADEVQVGFGRLGSDMWAFEMQGATPDIVTLGKPIGNGHPLAAVITTREIADAFDNGMEFFSTFGGNPVSCAVGLAVLDVLDEEKLRENALEVGAELEAGFRSLADRHESIGDVRGQGFFFGVEFVKNRRTREPAPEILTSAIEASRETGVLLSSDGPDQNVLKFKPPMQFNRTDAQLLLATLDRALMEADSG